MECSYSELLEWLHFEESRVGAIVLSRLAGPSLDDVFVLSAAKGWVHSPQSHDEKESRVSAAMALQTWSYMHFHPDAQRKMAAYISDGGNAPP